MAIREPFLVNPPKRINLNRLLTPRHISFSAGRGFSDVGARPIKLPTLSIPNSRRSVVRRYNPLSIIGLGGLNPPKKVKIKKGGRKVAKMPKGLKWGSKKYMEELRNRRTFSKKRKSVKATHAPSAGIRRAMESLTENIVSHKRGRPLGSHNKKKGRGRPKGSHNKRHRTSMSSGFSPVSGYRVGNMRILTNPYRRYGSRRRRNPVGLLSLDRLSLSDTLLLVLTAGVSGVVTKLVPGFLGSSILSNQYMRYGAQLLSGVAGYWALGKFVDKKHGEVWAITAGAIVVMDLLQSYLLSSFVTPAPVTTGVSGLVSSNYKAGQYTYPGQVGAFTNQRISSGVGAFVDPYHG